ncbi:hypothetical protein [Pseudomonas sp. R3-18-08]|uniref:hypothetical protein n=1 Tax=Pseudomonas sp. R3-18-08 TaxID=1173283 RepID=UPI000F5689DF|nr:hypothetical protein [Pseudomonas sp. R3-18-08]AZF16393.1 hypothetical protein C4J92_2911 [Pseudomonas sp. R3-18-08]
MKYLKYLIFVPVLMLSGCSTIDNLKSFTTAYIEPPSPTSSRLRVITNQTVRLVPGSTCVDWELPGVGMVNSRSFAIANDRTFNDRMLGIPGSDGIKNSSEVYIEPGKPITLVYAGTPASGRYQCFTSVHFLPEAGADYESNSGLCYITIEKITKNEDSGEISRTAVGGREAKVCTY